jgi:hypothetical protein
MSSKKQRKILFWAYFWKAFELISFIPLLMGEIGMIISALCLAACGIYCFLGVKFRWQSAHCIAQTTVKIGKNRYQEMNTRNYAWSDKEKGNLIAFGIIDIVAAVFLVIGFIVSF